MFVSERSKSDIEAEDEIVAVIQDGLRRSEPNCDIMFFSLPYWDMYAPFSAVPCLSAKLKSEGFSVRQSDLGIRCAHHLIRTKGEIAAQACLSEDYFHKKVKPYVKNQYADYKSFRNDMWFLQGTFDLKTVKERYFELNEVQKGVLDSFYRALYRMDDSSIDFDQCTGIDDMVRDWGKMNFLETLAEDDIISLLQQVPGVVGISVTSTNQFLPSCEFAKILKRCNPDIKIIFGGSCADLFVKSKYKNKQDIKQYFDFILIGEGETALTLLMNKICRNSSISYDEIPNMAIIDSDGNVSYTERILEDVNTLPLPDYDDLDLSLYFAPKTVLPYQTSRGCHYGFCAFCNHDESYRHNYRTKKMDRVVQELLELSKKYGIEAFQFVDEAIREDCFEEMIAEMDKHEEFKRIKWFYYSRVSRKYNKELLKKAKRNGCEMVMFGVETFNQRLLKLIKKGISAETSKYCLDLFHECGIKTYAWLLCNLPSETIEETKEDMEQAKNMLHCLDAFYIGIFSLYANTDMYIKPEQYNITRIHPTDPQKFTSHKNGVIIDKDTILDFCVKEYRPMQIKYCFTWSRYTLFFA